MRRVRRENAGGGGIAGCDLDDRQLRGSVLGIARPVLLRLLRNAGAAQCRTGKRCPGCGSTYADIAESGKVGCPQCYETFGDELSHLIGSVHGTTTHTGCVPSRHRAKKERADRLRALKKDLEAAISAEEYERAAKLRDEIRSLEKENEKEGK